MKSQLKVFALTAAMFAMMASWSPSANAGSLRQGTTSESAAVTGSLPGQVLWSYYMTPTGLEVNLCPPGSNAMGGLCNTTGEGDNIIRLINPNGAANSNLAGAQPQTVCAMLYVFDANQEMGECCGCPAEFRSVGDFLGRAESDLKLGHPGNSACLCVGTRQQQRIALGSSRLRPTPLAFPPAHMGRPSSIPGAADLRVSASATPAAIRPTSPATA